MNDVSVIIPTYNRASTICRAIDSVLVQTVKVSEIIVVDDGSSDGTPALLSGYGASIVVVRQNNKGVSAARNAGIRASHGDMIAFLDSDDEWLPKKLERQLSVFDARPQVGLVSSGARVVDQENGRTLEVVGRERCGMILEQLLFDDFITTSSMVVRRDCLASLGGRLFREDLSWGEDWEIKIRLAARCEVCVFPEILANYFITAQSLSRMHNADYFRRVIGEMFEGLKSDLVIAPFLQALWVRIQANVHFLVAREFYRVGNQRAARAELRMCLADLPHNHNLKSALLMYIFPVFVQRSFRKFKVRLKMGGV